MGSSFLISKRHAFRCDPSGVILEGLYTSKLQNFAQLQTVLALYDQETVRNNGQTCYLRLKTSVQLHIDQMMRTRNFISHSFEPRELMKTYKVCQICSIYAHKMMTFKISIQGGTKLLQPQVKFPRKLSSKIAGFCSASDCIGCV